MKNLGSIVFLVLVFALLHTDVCAQVDGVPTLGLNHDRFHSNLDPWFTGPWEREAPPPRIDGPRSPLPKREARALKEGLLAPSPGDRIAFAGFLRMPNTGLIRLLPRAPAHRTEVAGIIFIDSQASETKGPVNIRGGGAYYSFALLTHVYGYGSDIELGHETFSVGFAGADYGILTMLGDVPLEQISESDPRARFLAKYQPPKEEHLARAEALRFSLRGGVTIDDLNYQRRRPVLERCTYLLRSISYYRSDVLVAFRVVRKEGNGSVIIAWKLLRQYRAPVLQLGK